MTARLVLGCGESEFEPCMSGFCCGLGDGSAVETIVIGAIAGEIVEFVCEVVEFSLGVVSTRDAIAPAMVAVMVAGVTVGVPLDSGRTVRCEGGDL